MKLAVQIRDLSKTFIQGIIRKKRKKALKNISMDVPEGSICGVLGPNGAGKTTLLSIIAGILIPDKGNILVFGEDLYSTKGIKKVQNFINISSGHANFLWNMTVKENFHYYGMLYGIDNKERNKRIEELIDLFSLNSYKDVRFSELSTGTKQRLSLAKAFINDPKIVLLDEPTVGLDPDVAMDIRGIIKEFHKKKDITFILTTHNMEEAEELCDEVSFIFDGQIRVKGRPKELKKKFNIGDRIIIELKEGHTFSKDFFISGLLNISISNSYASIVVDDHSIRLPEIINRFIKEGIQIKRMEIRKADLEDVFISFSR